MSGPLTRAGRLLLGKNSDRDPTTVEWLLNDILAIEREAADAATIRDLVAAARERDELREAAEAIDDAWVGPIDRGQYIPVYGQHLAALRAALHREAEA